jgi:hypothetical protein
MKVINSNILSSSFVWTYKKIKSQIEVSPISLSFCFSLLKKNWKSTVKGKGKYVKQ